MAQPVEISLQTLIEAISDTETPVHARYIYRLSDLAEAEIQQLARVWENLPAWRRKALMEDVEVMAEKDTLLSFEALALFALADPDASVRLPAVRTLWEYETPTLVAPLLSLLDKDEDQSVRAAAAFGLGKFVYLGELEQIPADRLHLIEEALLKVWRGSEPETLKQRALEALGFSSRAEVPELIRSAYHSTDKAWTASALLAMGRSANEHWRDQVIKKLEDTFPVVRAEAARAAGELEIKAARRQLIDMLDDPDPGVRAASIWALSQIGGKGVRAALERMFKESEDEEEADFIEEALDNLAFSEDIQLYNILDIDPEVLEAEAIKADRIEEYEDELDDFEEYDDELDDDLFEDEDVQV